MRNSHRGHVLLAALLLITLASTAAGVLYLWQTRQNPPTTPPSTVTIPPETTPTNEESVSTVTPSSISPTPASSPTPADATANWKTYTNAQYNFSLKYPASLSLEERQKNYFVLLSDPRNPQSVMVSIDARLTGNYANYDDAVISTKKGLTDIQSKEINNGVKISGTVGPGYGQGLKITIALFKYLQSAVEVETTTTDFSQLEVFDQILTTFQFLE